MANLRIAELDFDQIKTNLKNFLKSQNEFSDYDFEGSGLSILIDLLAYNTHYNAYLANMVVNEMFLDSSVKRSSAVSLAKHLGYTPRSARGAVARVDITVTNPTGTPAILTLGKYNSFTTTISGVSKTFLNIKEYTTIPTNDQYVFSDVDIVEGQLLEYTYVVANPGPKEKYVVPNSNVDTTTLTVTVQNSASDLTINTYTQATDITSIDGSSEVYFLEENAQEKFEVYFGDGVLGKKLTTGNIVTIRYLATAGPDGNVSAGITQEFISNPIGGGIATVSVQSNSTGGTNKEDITSLKFYAPKFYASQNRAVTVADYSSLIQQNFTKADSIKVWGGEENDPPAYGRVFICIKPSSSYIITDDDRTFIANQILADRSMLTVRPIFVDPDYLYVRLTSNLKYDPFATTVSTSGIESAAVTAIQNYFNNVLQKFDSKFYYSQLVNIIKDTNLSIQSVIVAVDLQKRINPGLNLRNNFNLKYANRLHPATLNSTRFFITRTNQTLAARIKDVPDSSPSNYSGTGTLQLYNAETGTRFEDIGTVNYATGAVEITNITPVGYPTGINDIRISVEVQDVSLDLLTTQNQILVLDDSTLNNSVNRLSGLTVTATSI